MIKKNNNLCVLGYKLGYKFFRPYIGQGLAAEASTGELFVKSVVRLTWMQSVALSVDKDLFGACEAAASPLVGVVIDDACYNNS